MAIFYEDVLPLSANSDEKTLIGEGSYGKVYGKGEKVLKMSDLFFEDDIFAENVSEAMFLQTIRRFNLDCFPKVESITATEGSIELVMNNVGLPLDTWVKKKSFAERKAFLPSFLCQMARILLLLKQMNVMHFDIKPANICINDEGVVCLFFFIIFV